MLSMKPAWFRNKKGFEILLLIAERLVATEKTKDSKIESY
jgi:hypothetical protein